MKYLIVVPDLIQGSGLSRYVFTLSEILCAGNQVVVLETHNNNDDVVFEKKELNKISESIQLCSIGTENKWLRYIRVFRTILQFKPDIIINNYNGLVQYILPFISRNIKVVHVLHNDTDDFYRIGAINGNRVAGWIAPTISIADHFNRYTGERYADKVKVIPHGVEQPLKLEIRKSTRPELIFVGVHYEHKGVRILPDIIKSLLSLGLDFHFTIVGMGELTEWLKESLREQVSYGIVTFTGVVPMEEVYRLQSKADIFVYPTHIDAFGLVIAEAMINGTVPVITDLKGITDNLVTDSVNGYLLPQDDVDEFVNKIRQLLNDPMLLNKFKEAARFAAMERFTLVKMHDNYNSYLRQIYEK